MNAKFGSSDLRLRHMLELLFTAGVYFVLATLSLLVQFQSSNASPVWPPSGFAFAIMLLLGYRIAPGIAVGAFAANLFIFLSNKSCDLSTAVWLSFIIAVGNTSEALAGCYFLNNIIPNAQVKNVFQNVNHIFRFLFVTACMCLIGSTIGTTAVFLGKTITASQYSIVWLTWWLGDVSGILLLMPFILMWVKSFQAPSTIFVAGWKRKIEAVVLFLTVLLCSGCIFDNWFLSFSIFRWPFWIIPILVWAAVRFHQRETITAIVLCCAVAIYGTINRHGPFGALPINNSLLTVAAFVSIMVITKLLLNTSVLVSRRTQATLRKLSNELEMRVQTRTAELMHSTNELAEKNEKLLQQSEFINTLFDSVEDLMAVFDTHGNYLAVNKKIEQTYKLTKADLIGKNILDVFPGISKSDMFKDLQRAVSGELIHNFSYYSSISGKHFENFFIPLKDNNNEIYRVLVIGHDNTQLVEASKKIEQANVLLERKNKELEKMNQELDSFTYSASHDLQAPLRKIQTFVKLILENEAEVLSEKGKDYFNRMQVAAQRMHQLIEDLLSYSHTVDASEKHFEKINLNVLLEDVKTELKEKITETNTIIEVEDLPELNVIPFQFHQLFTNMLSNAIKFSKPGVPPLIRIKSVIIDGTEITEVTGVTEKKYYRFTISDNGIGFPSNFNEKIFGLFQRLHARKEYPGTGIGLSICKKIIENHRGILTATGMPDKGATFNIYLPA